MAELREIFRPTLFIIVNNLRPTTLLKKVSVSGWLLPLCQSQQRL